MIFSIKDKNKLYLLLNILFLTVAILITRKIGLMHGADFHVDEPVFFNSAKSVISGDFLYKPVKPYPNGAFVFQIPFQFLGRIYSLKSDINYNPQLWGRIAAVVYFYFGSLIGLFLCWKKTNKSNICVLIYSLIMSFSLFHLEQSRYGTGDPISLFISFCIIYIIDIYINKRQDDFYLYFSAFLCGVIIAIKFSLFIYLFFPIAGLILCKKNIGQGKLKQIIFILLYAFIGLILFSPAFFLDKTFFMQAFFTELNSYVVNFNENGFGYPINNISAVIIYSLLYSDFPFSILFSIFAVYRLHKKSKGKDNKDVFFIYMIPIFILVFLIMFSMASTLFMRSVYPFFFLSNIYVAIGVCKFYNFVNSHKNKLYLYGFYFIFVFFIFRGCMFTYSLSQKGERAVAMEILTSHNEWENRNLTVLFGEQYQPPIPERRYIYNSYDFAVKDKVKLQKGEFAVSGVMGNMVTRKRPFHKVWNQKFEDRIEGWKNFKKENEKYLIGQTESEFYTYFYGMWVHGSSLPGFELPIYRIYYRPRESEINTEILNKYKQLYSINDFNQYIESIQKIDSAVIFISTSGDISNLISYLNDNSIMTNFDIKNLGYVGIFKSNGDILFEDDNENAYIDLSSNFESESYLLSSINKDNPSSIVINQREYSNRGEGIHAVIYDTSINSVLDWFSLSLDENNNISFNKK